MSNLEPIIVSSLDMDRISALMDQMANLSAELERLEDELDRATIMSPEALPADVVRMHSTVKFKFTGNDKEIVKTLIYPHEVKGESDVSIFAPVGSALLGLSIGQQLTWPMPGGGEKTIEILDIIHQPESLGETR